VSRGSRVTGQKCDPLSSLLSGGPVRASKPVAGVVWSVRIGREMIDYLVWLGLTGMLYRLNSQAAMEDLSVSERFRVVD